MLQISGFDHLVLNVADAERSLAWYCGALGLAPERVEEWRHGEVPFPSVRVDPATVIDLLPGERTGQNMNHLCLVVDVADLEGVRDSGRFTVVDGPAPRWGARGVATSLYVLDPDDNIVELRHYA